MTTEELNEKRFLYVMDKINHMDILISHMTENYNNGMTNLAYIRFQNDNISSSLHPNAYNISPATLLIKEKNSKEFELFEDKENLEFFNDNEENIDDNIEDLQDLDLEKTNKKLDWENESLDDFTKRLSQNLGKSNEMKVLDEDHLEAKILDKEPKKSIKTKDPWERFGLISQNPLILHIKDSFNKVLEDAIQIANDLRKIKETEDDEKIKSL